MKFVWAIPAALLIVAAQAGIVGAAGIDQSRTFAQCLSEAQWPARASSAYKDAGATRKQQILNAYNADISAGRTLCKRLNTDAPGAVTDAHAFLNTQVKRYGHAADSHVERMTQLFNALSTPHP
ncbi:hypothetical protein [Asticcacaulis sp. 201]|uniref:hypothetical protein n=1 Tax=Asticcacaulis sp. 201 TaxID=3028787 RepID=UPI0029161670|nr:hypothetical protein [Asticcacaulis sp. 201]MDV6331200.1 hypothetical protein [Asticcacaulis sp. 201]